MSSSPQYVQGSIINLTTYFQDQLGNLILVDGATVTVVGPGNQLFLTNQILTQEAQGTYIFAWQTPVNLPTGVYQVLYEGFYQGQIRKDKGQFEIVAADAFNRPAAPTTRTGQLLNLLRDALADNMPNIKRKKWDDEELLSFLSIALTDINGTPAISNFSLDNYPDNWSGIILEGAVAWALRAYLIELMGQNIDFNDNGLSVSINNVVQGYLQLYNDAAQRFQQQAQLLKKNYRPMGMNILSGQVTGYNIRSLRFSQLLSIVNMR
jgi:hypothetical protein